MTTAKLRDLYKAGPVSTREPFTIPVDFNDVGAINVATGTIFTSQADVDQYLSDNGGTSFKYIDSIVKTLPALIRHNVVISIAAGTHDLDPGQAATSMLIDVQTTVAAGAELRIVGDPNPANWTEIVAVQTVQSLDTSPTDPSIQVVGTPYSAGALKGSFATTDTGQIAVIHDNTPDRVYITDAISGTPTTIRIVEPSTRIRATRDGINPWGASFVRVNSNSLASFPFAFTMENIYIDSFGTGSNTINVARNSMLRLYLCLLAGHTGNGALINEAGHLYLSNFSMRGQVGIGVADGPIGSVAGTATLISSFILGGEDRCSINDGFFVLLKTVLDGQGAASPSLGSVNLVNSSLAFQGFATLVPGKQNEIRNGFGAGLVLNNCIVLSNTPGCTFKNMAGPAIKIEGKTDLDFFTTMSSSIGIVDGGGNTDVGIEVAGSFSQVKLSSTKVTVTGSVGDLRIEGVVGPYGDLPAVATPLITDQLNQIGRG